MGVVDCLTGWQCSRFGIALLESSRVEWRLKHLPCRIVSNRIVGLHAGFVCLWNMSTGEILADVTHSLPLPLSLSLTHSHSYLCGYRQPLKHRPTLILLLLLNIATNYCYSLSTPYKLFPTHTHVRITAGPPNHIACFAMPM